MAARAIRAVFDQKKTTKTKEDFETGNLRMGKMRTDWQQCGRNGLSLMAGRGRQRMVMLWSAMLIAALTLLGPYAAPAQAQVTTCAGSFSMGGSGLSSLVVDTDVQNCAASPIGMITSFPTNGFILFFDEDGGSFANNYENGNGAGTVGTGGPINTTNANAGGSNWTSNNITAVQTSGTPCDIHVGRSNDKAPGVSDLDWEGCTSADLTVTFFATRNGVDYQFDFFLTDVTDGPTSSTGAYTVSSFQLTGGVYGSAAAPELDVRNAADNADILDGGTTISTALGTDFGNQEVGTLSAANSFLVKNTGTSDLIFDATGMSIDNTTDFTVTVNTLNSATLTNGSSSTVSIRFNPQSTGLKTATVTLNSNDANEDPYTFEIAGTGVDTTGPVISQVTAVSTPGNDTTPSYTFTTDETGTLSVGGSCGTSSSTSITSTGNQTITLTDTSNNPLAAGTYTNCTVTVTDAAGNASSALDITDFEIDTTGPTPVISTVNSDPTNVAIPISIAFGEEVTGFIQSDLTFTNANISGFTTSDNTTFTATLTPSGDGAVTANVVGGVAADLAGNANSASNAFSIEFDGTGPVVTSVAVPANATYVQGQNLDFTVNFDENVTVNTSGGTPQLAVTIGSTTRQAVYQSGTGTSALLFRYTVQAGEEDSDGIAVGTLAANGGTLRDGANNNAVLTLNSVGVTTGVLVDAVVPVPTLNIVDTSLSDSDTTSVVNITFTEAVTGFDVSDLTPTNGSLSGFSGSGDTYSVNFIADDGVDGTGQVTLGGSYTDAAGNNGGGTSDTVTIDRLNPSPTVNIVDASLNDTDNNSVVNIIFNEAVTGFDAMDLAVLGGTISGFSGSGDTYSATFTAMDNSTTNGQVAVNGGGYTDAAGNTGFTGSDTVAVNTVNPTVTVAISESNLNDTTDSSNVSFTFSEAPTGFGAGSLTLVGGAVGTITMSTATIYETTFTATDGFTGTGSVTVDAGGYTNAAGNDGASDNDTVNIDRGNPMVTVNIVATNLDDGTPTSNVTFEFSEDVTGGFALGNISATNGAISNLTQIDGDSFTATFTADDNIAATGTVTVNNLYSDLVGNIGTGNSDTVAINTNNPTVAVDIVETSLNDTTPSSNVTFTFSSAPTSFTNANVMVSGGNLGTITGGGISYSATLTVPDGSTTNAEVTVIAGSYTDGTGNPGTAGMDQATVDRENPTLTISIADASLNDANNSSNVSFTFTEAPTGFVDGDIATSGGTLSPITGGPTVFNATFTAADDSTTAGSVSVAGGTYTDAAGNSGGAGNDTVTVNTVNPTVTVDIVSMALSDTTTSSVVNFTFSEAVNGFEETDLSLVGGSISGFSFTDGNTSGSATFTADDNAATTGSVTVMANSYTNTAGGNDGAAGSDTVSIDRANPTITSVVRQTPSAAVVNDDSLTFRVTFSENVIPALSTDFNTTGATGTTGAVASVGAAVFDITFTGGDLATFNGAVGLSVTGGSGIADPSGNVLTNTVPSGANEAYSLDNTPPAASSISPFGAAATVASMNYSVVFSEDASNVSADDFTVTTVTGTATGTVGAPTGGPFAFTVPITGLSGTGTIRLDLNGSTNIVDAIGNGDGTNGNVAAKTGDGTHFVDLDAPTVTSITRQNPTTETTNADSVTFRVTFSEDVQNVDLADFQATGPTGATIAVATVSASTYDVTVSGGDMATLNGTVALGFAGGQDVQDVSSNALSSTAPTGANETYTIDNQAPTVTISSTSSGTVTGDFPISVVFAEAVTGFVEAEMVVSGATVSGFTTSDNITFTATLTPTADGTVTVDVAASVAQDAGGNDNAAAAQFSIGADVTAPTLSIVGPTTPQTTDFTITINADENVTDLTLADIVVTNATPANLSAATGTTFTVDITSPVAGTTVDVTIAAGAVMDDAGNANTAAATFSVTAGSPVSEFENNKDDIIDTVQGDVRRNLQNEISANQEMMDNALDRFIEERQGDGASRDVPFDVTGFAELSGLSFSTKGDFYALKNLSSGATRFVFGQFDLTRDEDGSTTGQLSGRVVWERALSDTAEMGYFIGGRIGKSDLNGTFAGDSSTLGVVGGVYGLKQLGEAFYGTGYLAAGYSWSDLSISNGTLALNGTYDTASYYAGVELAGAIDVSPAIEFRPNLAIDYGYAQIGAAGFDATAFGLTAPVSTDFGSVSVLEGSATPEIILSLDQWIASSASLSFAPSVICRSTTGRVNTSSCGGGLGVELQMASEDGRTRADLGYEYSEVGGTRQQSLRFSVEMEF